MLPAAPPSLEYASRPTTRRRRWGRRVLRWWPAWLVGVVAGLGVAYGPGVWRHVKLMRLQEACMGAAGPADRPVFEGDRAAARALVARWPGEYHLDPHGWAVRIDPQWAALGPGPGARPGRSGASVGAFATVFCHERHTPDGRRRLVVVEGMWGVTVIDPAGWLGGAGARVARQADADYDDATHDALMATAGLPGSLRVGAGVPDPADPTRWTVQFVQGGVAGTWEYRLADDDAVKMRLFDSAGFKARVGAAWAAAATRPAAVAAPDGR